MSEERSELVSPYAYAKSRGLQPQIVYYLLRKGGPHVIIGGHLYVNPQTFDQWREFLSELRTIHVVYRSRHQHDGTCQVVNSSVAEGHLRGMVPRAPVTLEDFKTAEAKQARRRHARRAGKERDEAEEGTSEEVD